MSERARMTGCQQMSQTSAPMMRIWGCGPAGGFEEKRGIGGDRRWVRGDFGSRVGAREGRERAACSHSLVVAPTGSRFIPWSARVLTARRVQHATTTDTPIVSTQSLPCTKKIHLALVSAQWPLRRRAHRVLLSTGAPPFRSPFALPIRASRIRSAQVLDAMTFSMPLLPSSSTLFPNPHWREPRYCPSRR